MTSTDYGRGWADAIAAVNGQFAEGMADTIREARAQALRDAADEIQVDVPLRYQAAATDQVRAWLRGRAEQQMVPPAPMDWGETP